LWHYSEAPQKVRNFLGLRATPYIFYLTFLSTKLFNSETDRMTYKDLLVDISSSFFMKLSFQNFGQSFNVL